MPTGALNFISALFYVEDLFILIGQCVWIFLGFDSALSDLRPTGLSAQYASDFGLFATLGGYGVLFYNNNTAMMYAGQVKLGYAYAVVGADSIYYGLKDSDFGSGLNDTGTDVKGHRISASYAITKHMSAGITAMLDEADESDNPRDVNLYQFDVNYKF